MKAWNLFHSLVRDVNLCLLAVKFAAVPTRKWPGALPSCPKDHSHAFNFQDRDYPDGLALTTSETNHSRQILEQQLHSELLPVHNTLLLFPKQSSWP